MGALPLNWSQFILTLSSVLVASLICHPNLVKTYGFKVNEWPPSPLAAAETTSSAPPTPVTSLRAPPRPFTSPIPPIYGQSHNPLRQVHSGPSMVHRCQPQQYQPYPAYLVSYMSASPYPNSPWLSAFPHYREVERKMHDHERRSYTPTEPRSHDPTKLQDDRNDEPTESRKRDHAEPDNVGKTVRNNFTLHKPKGFGKQNSETKSHSILAFWRASRAENAIINETIKEVILQNVQKSIDCADKRNGTLTHKEQLTLFGAIVKFLFTCTGMREKMIISATVHAVLQAIVNIEEKNEDDTV